MLSPSHLCSAGKWVFFGFSFHALIHFQRSMEIVKKGRVFLLVHACMTACIASAILLVWCLFVPCRVFGFLFLFILWTCICLLFQYYVSCWGFCFHVTALIYSEYKKACSVWSSGTVCASFPKVTLKIYTVATDLFMGSFVENHFQISFFSDN